MGRASRTFQEVRYRRWCSTSADGWLDLLEKEVNHTRINTAAAAEDPHVKARVPL